MTSLRSTNTIFSITIFDIYTAQQIRIRSPYLSVALDCPFLPASRHSVTVDAHLIAFTQDVPHIIFCRDHLTRGDSGHHTIVHHAGKFCQCPGHSAASTVSRGIVSNIQGPTASLIYLITAVNSGVFNSAVISGKGKGGIHGHRIHCGRII